MYWILPFDEWLRVTRGSANAEEKRKTKAYIGVEGTRKRLDEVAKTCHFMTRRMFVDNLTPFTDPDEVLAAIQPITKRVHSGLHRLLPQTRRWFESKGVPVDKALHAMMTRFELKNELRTEQIFAVEEEELDPSSFTIEGVANCGLVIRGPNCVLRLLKWRNQELPRSASKERFEFYQGNLFAFETNDPFPDSAIPPLNLVAAWETTPEHELQSFSIVCPFGECAFGVTSKWWRTLELPLEEKPRAETLPSEPVLDEITPKHNNQTDNIPGSSSADSDIDSDSTT